ncbi:MAG: hypothetical protein OXR84_05380 [Magnetovibrio sp.]|nr:hypothetical protein [Magnetovibrio sp.]
MADVTLTAATRTALQLLQRTADVRTEAGERLSTGRRVSRIDDDPAAVFQAQALQGRVRDLLEAKDQIGQAESAVEGALAGLDAIEDLAGQLKGIALSVQGGSAEARQAAAEQFDVIRQQITALANDVSFGGVSLLASTPGNLSVNLDGEGATDLTVEGSAADAAGLGIGSAATDFNNFVNDTDVTAAVSQVNAAITKLRASATDLGTDLSTLAIRDQFNRDLIDTLDTGTARLVDADLTEEAARAISAEVRQQLGVETLRIASESRSVLANFI